MLFNAIYSKQKGLFLKNLPLSSYTDKNFKSFEKKYQYFHDVSPNMKSMFQIRNQTGPPDIPNDVRVFALDSHFGTGGSKCYTQKNLPEAFKLLNYYPHLYESHGLSGIDINIRFPIDLDIKHQLEPIEAIRMFFETFIEFWNLKFPHASLTLYKSFQISRVANKDYPKVSVHAIVKDFYFLNIQECKQFALDFITYFRSNVYNDNMTQYIITNIKHLVECNILKDVNEFQLKSNTDKASFFLDHILGFDKSIYGNRFFRTLYSSKNKEIDNTSYPCDPVTFLCDINLPQFETWKDHLATWIPNDCQQISYQKKLIPNNNNEEKTQTLCLSMKLPSSQNKYKKKNNKYHLIQDVIEFLPEKYSTEYDSWIKMGYILKNNLKNINTKEKNKEYIFTEQNSFNLFLNFSQKSKNADSEPNLKQFFYTLDVKNMVQQELSFGTVFHWAKDTILQLADRHQFPMDQNLTIYPQKQDSKYMNNPFLNPQNPHGLPLPQNQIIIFQANPGTGKTTTSVQFWQSLSHLQLIIPTYRRSLCAQLYKSIKKAGLNVGHYQEDDSHTFINSDVKVVQLDSIGKLKKNDEDFKYDIWFDEVSGFLKYACSSTTFKNNSFNVLTEMFHYIEKARNILCTDADISQDELDFLRAIRPDMKVQLHTHDYVPPKECPIEFYTMKYKNFVSLGNEVLDSLINEIKTEDKIPVMIFSDSKSLIDLINKYIETHITKFCQDHKNFKIYTSEMGDLNDINKDLEDIWTNLISFSPSITTGVDYTTPCKVFGFYRGRSLTPREFVQQGERARNKLMYKVVSVATKTNYDKIQYNYKRFKDQIIEKEDQMNKTNNHKNPRIIKKEYRKYFKAFDEYTYQYEYRSQLEKAFPNEMLMKIFQTRGYKVNLHQRCHIVEDLGSLNKINMNPKQLFNNMRRELKLHGEMIMDPEMEDVYLQMWDYLETQYQVSHEKWTTLSQADKITLLLDPEEMDWKLMTKKKKLRNQVKEILEAIERERKDDRILWVVEKNRLGVLNFMSFAHKIYGGIRERIQFFKKTLAEVLENDFLWDLVTYEENFRTHLSLRYMWKDEQKIQTIIKNQSQTQRVKYLFDSTAIMYHRMIIMEKYLGIEDRFSVTREFIKEKVINKTVCKKTEDVNNDFLKNVKDVYKFERNKIKFDDDGEISWLDLYKMLTIIWKKYFGNLYKPNLTKFKENNVVICKNIELAKFDYPTIELHRYMEEECNNGFAN